MLKFKKYYHAPKYDYVIFRLAGRRYVIGASEEEGLINSCIILEINLPLFFDGRRLCITEEANRKLNSSTTHYGKLPILFKFNNKIHYKSMYDINTLLL